MENYLNTPEAAKEERGGSMSEMGPKLRATMERLHREAEERKEMKEIDTIREALEMAMEYVGTEGGMMTRQEAKLQIALKAALAALSTIEAEVKPQEPSENVVGLAQRIESRFHQGHYAEDYNAIAAIITAHDDAIKLECVRMAKLHLVCKSGFSSLEAAILGTEPAREES